MRSCGAAIRFEAADPEGTPAVYGFSYGHRSFVHLTTLPGPLFVYHAQNRDARPTFC